MSEALASHGSADLAPLLERLFALGRRGARLGLDRMSEALALLDEPHAGLAAIHIAGTNGKGSTAAMLESIARHAGLRTGLYTSPHLASMNERIRIDGEPIDDQRFAAALGRALDEELPPLSLFETMTLAAFLAMRDAKVELAVIEVGLGGRLDATNVLERPLATAITSIGLDHQGFLGTTLASIAREKAGIARSGVPLVVAPLALEAARAVAEVARAAQSELVWLEDEGAHVRTHAEDASLGGARLSLVRHDSRATLRFADGEEVTLAPRLAGAHQLANAAVAATCAHLASRSIPELAQAIAGGVSSATWPGRLERVSAHGRTFLFDCAHNTEGMLALCAYLERDAHRADRTVLVFGAIDDKPHLEMLAMVAPLASRRIYCRPIDPIAGRHAAEPSALADAWPGSCHDGPSAALAAALAKSGPDDLVLVTGSIFLVGAVRALFLELPLGPAVPL